MVPFYFIIFIGKVHYISQTKWFLWKLRSVNFAYLHCYGGDSVMLKTQVNDEDGSLFISAKCSDTLSSQGIQI
jgi:hypothetical protein